MKPIRIGVLGCASIANRSFIPAILSLPEKFNLAAVASRTLQKAEETANIFNCEAVEGYDNLIKRDDIDALYIPLPTGLHKEYIPKALSANKHVYAEKSIAMNVEDAKIFVDLAQKNNLALMEGYMFQYHKQHQKVFEIINSGIIGEIRHFSASFGFPPLDKNNFRYDPYIGGGALMDCAGYTVKAASFILKEELKVVASAVNYKDKTSVFGSAFLKGKNGLGISVSFGFDNFYQCCYQIWGSKGKISLPKAFTPKEKETTYIILETHDGINKIEIEPDNHFAGALKHFDDMINSDNKTAFYQEIITQSQLLEDIKNG